MTDEQLEALENWIVALIRIEDRASGLSEAIRVNALRKDVRRAFGMIEEAE